MKQLQIAYSPCPNDTFAFDAWVHGKIKSKRKVEPILADIQQLNAWAYEGRYPVIKVSTFCLGKITDKYQMLPSGAAICEAGPLLIAKEPFHIDELKNKRVLVPGLDTTAYLLFSTLCPEPLEIGVVPFDSMMEQLKNDEADAALIIHETRFTFEAAGFHQILDLGKVFTQTFGTLLPLGVVVAKKEVYEEAAKNLKASIQYALENPTSSKDYVQSTSQEKDEAIIKKHIETYVTEETLQITSNGQKAIQTLFTLAIEKGLLTKKSLAFDEANLFCHI